MEERFASEANWEAKRFSTKAELLKHLGKNEKDNKLVDRMMLKGLVYKESGMYVLVDKDLEIERLKEENEVLVKQIKKLKEEWSSHSEWKKEEGNNALIAQLKEEIKWLNSDLDYQIAENEKLEKKVAEFQECIRRCYLWARNVKKDKTPRPVFKKEVLKLNDNLPGEDNN